LEPRGDSQHLIINNPLKRTEGRDRHLYKSNLRRLLRGGLEPSGVQALARMLKLRKKLTIVAC